MPTRIPKKKKHRGLRKIVVGACEGRFHEMVFGLENASIFFLDSQVKLKDNRAI